MGHKVHPTGIRLAYPRTGIPSGSPTSRSTRNPDRRSEGARAAEEEARAGRRSRRILIERPAKNARITIYTARPGVVIGKKGEEIE